VHADNPRFGRRWLVRLVVLPLVASLAAACAMRVGPQTVPRDRFDYGTAVKQSWQEQLLVNLVRLRYLDTPVFLDVDQIVAQYTLNGTVGLSTGSLGAEGQGAPVAGASGAWTESPVITFTPMSGERFTQSLLRPVSPANLLALAQIGWPVDAIFGVAVRAVNGLYAASRTVAFHRAADPEFARAVDLLRKLQTNGGFGFRVEAKESGATTLLTLRPPGTDPAADADAKALRELLRLSPDAQEFTLSMGAVPQSPTDIALQTRSALEIFAEASAGVQIPAADLGEGRATRMETPGPSATPAAFALQVKASAERPSDREAFASVRYRTHWFYVDDRDLESKRSLGFLMLLFTLIESDSPTAPPLLTIGKP
jgi:hypothetical protein